MESHQVSTASVLFFPALAAGLTIFAIVSFYFNSIKSDKKAGIPTKPSLKSLKAPTVTPVSEDFDWKKCQPYKYRPFKNVEYKINLAIRKEDPNDWIFIENTYLDRTNLRKEIYRKNPSSCHGFHESALPALREAYDVIFDFLLRRYPMYFSKTEDKVQIYNSIRDEYVPASSANLSGEQIEKILAVSIEEDFLIMLKNHDSDQPDEYIVRATVSCFPAGFNPVEKLNMPLTAVHGPVPHYKKRLQFSMNKFFARLRPYEFIVRNNWGFQLHAKLCAVTGSHATEEDAEEIVSADPESLDFNKVFFRVEKQSFTRLPKSKGNIMLTRTYVTAASKLREDVDVEKLCGAIDGVKGETSIYKRRIQWGEPVKAYMRRQTNGITDEVYDYKFVE